MRAAANVEAGDYETAAEALEAVLDASRYYDARPRGCLQTLTDCLRTKADRAPGRRDPVAHVLVRVNGVALMFPTDNDVLDACADLASRGPERGLKGLGRAAHKLRKHLKNAIKARRDENAKLKTHLNPLVDDLCPM